ncbi:MAG: hypothetical protein RSD32_07505 [Oscillospiraceae bacterium]
MSKDKKIKQARQAECSHFTAELSGIQSSLDEAYIQFNNTVDPDALDACIFEISALRSRYNTTLKHFREKYH